MTGPDATMSPWIAAAGGGAATLGAQALWTMPLSSVGPACAALLATGALAVLAGFGSRTDRSRHAMKGLATTDGPIYLSRPSASPETWLRDIGATRVRDAEIEGFVRARLEAAITPLGPSPTRPGTRLVFEDMAEPVALLALAFALRVSCENGFGRKAGSVMLDGLRDAMAHGPGQTRHDALRGIRMWSERREPECISGRPEAIEAYHQVRRRHATRESFLLGLLDEARRHGGTLVPAEFAWLKDVDRSLWYALDNLGRGTFHVEGLAAIEHYQAEVRAEEALDVPQVDGTVAALSALCREMRREQAEADVI